MHTDAKVSIALSYNENKPEGIRAHVLFLHIDCGQRRLKDRRKRNIIEADDCNILRDDCVFDNIRYTEYDPGMAKSLRDRKYEGWLKAVSGVLTGE